MSGEDRADVVIVGRGFRCTETARDSGGPDQPVAAMPKRTAAEIGAAGRYKTLPLAVTFDKTAPDTRCEPWRDPSVYAPGTCVHCGHCVIGCEHGAKKSLDKAPSRLRPARRHAPLRVRVAG